VVARNPAFERRVNRVDAGVPEGGQFAPASAGTTKGLAAVRKAAAARLRKAKVDDLLSTWLRQATRRGTDDPDWRVLDAELARRDGGTKPGHVDQALRDRQVWRLAERGGDFVEAYALVHGKDPAKVRRAERMRLVDAERRPGEAREKTMRRMYADHVERELYAAEAAANGHLLSRAGRAAGVGVRALWSAPAATARKHASEELMRWWADHGGRVTYADFRARYTGEARQATDAGRDWGL